MVPRPSRYFTGRVELLQEIAERLQPRRSGPGHVPLHGLDGVGKSAVATEFARRHRDQYAAVEWMRASSERLLASGYARIAEVHGLTAGGRDPRDRVRTWLEHRQDRLLVLDDVPDPELLRSYVPDPATSRVLITSRYAAWREFGSPIRVEPLKRQEAVALVLAHAGQAEPTAAGGVAELLGDLPLALEQAAGYCVDNRIPLPEYARRLRGDLEGVLELGVRNGGRRTVAGVWTASLRAVRRDSPAAHELLSVLSFLGPGRLEHADLQPAQELLLPVAEGRHATGANPVHQLMWELGRHSLVHAEQADVISVHRLVQAVVRASMTTQDRRRHAEAAVELVAGAFPVDVERRKHRPVCERLVEHALAAIAHAQALEVASPAADELLARVDRFRKHSSD